MSVTVKTRDLFNGENSIRMFLEKTENKDFAEKIPFELTYWATKLSNKLTSILRDVRESLQKLNDEYGLKQENANKPLIEVLGSQAKVDEFNDKREVIMDDEVKVDIFPKKVSLFEKTGIGGVTLMGLLPFLEDDFDGIEKPKKEKTKKEE